LLKPQGLFFADGSDRHFHAVITNQREMDGGRLLQWHREKAGTLEHTHHKVKNYAAWEKPSQRFGVNGAWFKLALLAYNLVSAIIAAYLLDLIPIPLPNLPQPARPPTSPDMPCALTTACDISHTSPGDTVFDTHTGC
jgi:hypothetical protein